MDVLRFCVDALLGCAGFGLFVAATLTLTHQLALAVGVFIRRVLQVRNHTEVL